MSGVELAVLAAVTSAASAYSTIQAGKAEAYMLEAEANQANLQGRVQAIQYEQEANASLGQLERVMAANTARAAAGNMNPLASGSSQDLIGRLNMREGVNEFTIARDNATMAKKMAEYQAGSLRTAASNVKKAARTQAFIQLGQGALSAGQVYGTDGFYKMNASGQKTLFGF